MFLFVLASASCCCTCALRDRGASAWGQQGEDAAAARRGAATLAARSAADGAALAPQATIYDCFCSLLCWRSPPWQWHVIAPAVLLQNSDIGRRCAPATYFRDGRWSLVHAAPKRLSLVPIGRSALGGGAEPFDKIGTAAVGRCLFGRRLSLVAHAAREVRSRRPGKPPGFSSLRCVLAPRFMPARRRPFGMSFLGGTGKQLSLVASAS